MSSVIDRSQAEALLFDWVKSESLRRHCRSVELSMRHFAAMQADVDIELWGIAGLLHDADYERFPDTETGHPRMIIAELKRLGADPELVDAIAGHADYMNVPRQSAMAKTLYAVDELSGFVVACAIVRPTGLQGLTAKSVKKKLKTVSFAAAVNRSDIDEGAQALGVDLTDHITNVIAALQPHAEELGLAPAATQG